MERSTPSDVAGLAKQIRTRCEAANIEAEIDDDFFGEYAVTLKLPSGRNTRPAFFVGNKRLATLASLPFEKYVFLGQLWALCSYEDDVIEALVTTPAGANPKEQLVRRLEVESDDPSAVMLTRSNGQVTLEIGSASPVLKALTYPRAKDLTALKVKGLGAKTHDTALERIVALANSLFFDIDANLGLPLILARERGMGPLRTPSGDADVIKFPQSEHDPDPMSLYWYGRGAVRMPLLQFLAFYQVLEFYFPFYADQEVRRRVKGIVRHPGFNPHSENQISGLIKATATSKGYGFGDERSQLRATVRGCGTPDAVREQVSGKGPQKYFGDKRQGASEIVVRPDLADDELMDRVADRIYEIRCRIVHTKDSDVRGQLLPFSPEAERLGPDIRLIEGIARGALAVHSRELKLHP